MRVTAEQIRNYRLQAHHLDRKMPMNGVLDAAGACGLQNSPPGAWEAALFNRLDGCSMAALHDALCRKKTLLQAWSYRGVPAIFPTAQSDVFLTPLIARAGEEPWIYTRGITGALDYLQMTFDDLLVRLKKAIRYLDVNTIKSKEALDQVLADIVENGLAEDKRALWRAPSMYGSPDRQTVGGAAVSFLLRPCSFSSLVVFGERQEHSPTFTSFKNWVGRAPQAMPGADKELVRKFLHCYGPATVDYLMAWLGCSKKQARRLWDTVKDEITPVEFGGKTCYMLDADMENLRGADGGDERLLLLSAHDPYLGLNDRTTILENSAHHKAVWKFIANPGVVLRGGRIAGLWKSKTAKDKLDIAATLWEPLRHREQAALKQLAEEYAAFRLLTLRSSTIEGG